MRLVIAAAALVVLAACSPASETAAPVTTSAAETAQAADPHAGHDMAAMDPAMKHSDAADDVAATMTPDNHTFHTYPGKFEKVLLPFTEGGYWTMKGETPANLALTGTGSEDLPDGAKAFAARFEMKASGNATIVFERRGSENAADPVLELRTINFMVH